jgi:hypothetical protein
MARNGSFRQADGINESIGVLQNELMTDHSSFYIGTLAAALIGLASLYLTWRLGRRKLSTLPSVVAVIAFIVAGGLFWYTHRPLPVNVSGEIFNGIHYSREVLDGPIIIYTVRINLRASGIGFMVTPARTNQKILLAARTTSQFVQEFGVQLAINADYFDPWRDNGFWDYYPHENDGVNVRGLAVSQGNLYTKGYAPPNTYNTLYLTKDNHASFVPPKAPIYNAISGNMMLVTNGKILPIDTKNDYLTGKHPRTAVALDKTANTLIIVLVDGRQPNYSEGVTIPELEALIVARGGYNALNLDGGGSVTLAIQGQNGLPEVLNSPIHSHIPGRERPVGNHLGVFAQPVGG